MKNGIKILIFVYPIFCKDIHKMMISNHSLLHPVTLIMRHLGDMIEPSAEPATTLCLQLQAPVWKCYILSTLLCYHFKIFYAHPLFVHPRLFPGGLLAKAIMMCYMSAHVLHICACNMSWFLIQRRYYFYLVGNN